MSIYISKTIVFKKTAFNNTWIPQKLAQSVSQPAGQVTLSANVVGSSGELQSLWESQIMVSLFRHEKFIAVLQGFWSSSQLALALVEGDQQGAPKR